MKQQICVCCGEPIPPEAEPRPENPNVCPSCLALASQLNEPSVSAIPLERRPGDRTDLRINPG